MNEHHDPLDALASPIERQEPRPSFARSLRARLTAELGLDETAPRTIQLPERRRPMAATQATGTQTTGTQTTGSDAAAAPPPTTTAITPYITTRDAAAAIDWYSEAFRAVEQFRVVGDDGMVGHAELAIGSARVMLSDEYPTMHVVSPATLGGTTAALHLDVADVDATFQRAVEAGATALREPEDQPHGARHGTLLDPFGHRWMLSQTLEDLSVDDYADRAEGSGFTVEKGPASSPGAASSTVGDGSIWAAVFYRDALAGIRFLVDVFGFEEQLVVTAPDDDTNVVHSQIRWPEGGIVQAGTYDPDNPFSRPPGQGGLYVITADPQSVWDRCRAAGVEVIREPESPEYDPAGIGFSVRDPEGNTWSFGTYAGEAARRP